MCTGVRRPAAPRAPLAGQAQQPTAQAASARSNQPRGDGAKAGGRSRAGERTASAAEGGIRPLSLWLEALPAFLHVSAVASFRHLVSLEN